MRVLVTGGCGFIGSNFLNLAFKKNFESIMNIDSLTYASNQENINIEDQNNYEFRNIDITNKDLLKKAAANWRPKSLNAAVGP